MDLHWQLPKVEKLMTQTSRHCRSECHRVSREVSHDTGVILDVECSLRDLLFPAGSTFAAALQHLQECGSKWPDMYILSEK